MALIIDGTTVENVLYKSSPTATPLQLDKLVFEGVTVWENLVYHTGQLYWPTSNTSPKPFTVSDWSSGSFNGDGSDKAWKVFGDGYYAKQADVNGKWCGAQIMFNTTAEIYPVELSYYGGNQDAGGGGGGGRQELWVNTDKGWERIAYHDDIGGGTVKMDGKTRVYGVRMRTIYGSGAKKWLEANSGQITKWYQKGKL